jgi:photosystem II stability/assembly factor-like uncharacterized protein
MRSTAQFLLSALSAALAIAAAAQTPGPAPRSDAWKIIGPGGGGTMIAPTISPHDPRIVLERCDMTGSYITRDGGQSWRMFNLRAGMETFAFDPGNPRRIYAGGAALWRSDDTGRTWRMIFPNPRKQTVEHQNGDHGDYSLTSKDGSYVTGLTIRQIVADPTNSNVIHIAFSDPRNGGTTLMISKDSGGAFRREREYPSDRILLLAYPGGERLAIGTLGVYRGESKTAKPIARAREKITHAGISEADGKIIIYVTTGNGELLVSEDAGGSWQLRTPALGQKSGEFGAVAAAGGNGRIAYVGFRGLKLGDSSEETYNGIAKTVDLGSSWTIVFRESTHAASNLDASWIEQRAVGIDWGSDKSIIFDAPNSLGVAPGNPGICYATDLFRTYRTLNGGKTWAQVNSARAADNRWTTSGLDVTTSYGVQFDPFDAKHIFIDYTDIGAFHSYDGGQSWETATNGVPDNWRNTTYWLAFDPDLKGLLWGAFSGIHDLPRPKMWRGGDFLARAKGGVGVSTDGGRSWTPSNVGMTETAVTHVLLDPATPVGQRTLYACGFGAGVYKSTDNGKSWQLKNEGIEETHPFAWRITRGNDGALYLIVARTNEGRFGETSGSGALYKSTDGAEHWTKMNLPAGVNGPSGLALDPRDNRRMYLAAWGQEREGVDTGGGVFLSTDGGQSWKPVFTQAQHVYDVTIDPKAPDILYICGFDAAAYRSTDAGLTWTRIRGYNFKWGHRVMMDPNDAAKIYIATYGGSVWHGPAAGDASAVEDVVTPVPVAQ